MQINVITTDGIPRNQELKGLAQLNLITGIDGRTSDFKVPSLINQDFNLLVLGTKLSKSQAAAVLSHRIAQTTFDGEWCCVLEDDAVILDVPKFYESLNDIKKLRIKNPAIILLYTGFGGVLGKTLRVGKNFSVAHVFSPPTGAVAYAMNDSAKDSITVGITGR